MVVPLGGRGSTGDRDRLLSIDHALPLWMWTRSDRERRNTVKCIYLFERLRESRLLAPTCCGGKFMQPPTDYFELRRRRREGCTMDRWIHASFSSRSRLFGCTVTAANAAYAYAGYAYSSKDATSIWSPTPSLCLSRSSGFPCEHDP